MIKHDQFTSNKIYPNSVHTSFPDIRGKALVDPGIWFHTVVIRAIHDIREHCSGGGISFIRHRQDTEPSPMVNKCCLRDVEQPIGDASADFLRLKQPQQVLQASAFPWWALFASTPAVASTHRLVLSLMKRQDQSSLAKGSEFSERHRSNKPHWVDIIREQQCFWSNNMSQPSPLSPKPSHSSTQTADFWTPCLFSREGMSRRLAFVMFFHSPPKLVSNRRQLLPCSLNTGSLTIWGVEMSTTLDKPPFGTSSIGVTNLLSVTSATNFSADALASIQNTKQPR